MKHPEAKDSIYYFSTKAPRAYTEVDYKNEVPSTDVFITFGKESKGLPEELLYNNKERSVRIPMLSELRSLNLSNAVAIAVYEILRQDSFDGLQEEGKLTRYDW